MTYTGAELEEESSGEEEEVVQQGVSLALEASSRQVKEET